MYNPQQTVLRIKSIAKSKGIKTGVLLDGCGLGINTLNKMENGKDILSGNFYKIAEYLDVSIDYLVGRTEKAEVNR